MRNLALEEQLFNCSNENSFEELALEIFDFQYKNVTCYQTFCNYLGRIRPQKLEEIPFIPISFFKSHKMATTSQKEEIVFKSSGTTGTTRSNHYIPFLDVYERSFLTTYKQQIGNPKEQVILALLPNYLEQGDSSLVYMVNYLIQQSNHQLSGFYLNNYEQLIKTINKAKTQNKDIVLFGVTYALLDLAEMNVNLSGVTVIETGGMKGRRKELIKEELHLALKRDLSIQSLNSEYGMTELLSQAYLSEDLWFQPPKWMKILIRDVNDVFNFLPDGQTGGVNIIDLANLYTCSFIATDDLGQKKEDLFKIMGRFDNSDIRGCNLLVN